MTTPNCWLASIARPPRQPSAQAPVSLIGAIALAALATAPIAGAQTVDQVQLEANQNRAVLPGTFTGQSLTPELPGFLSGIEISVSIHPLGQPLHVEVLSGSLRSGYVLVEPADAGGYPDTLDAESITGTFIDFSPFAIPSVPGRSLELRTWTTEAALLTSVRISTSDSYAAGTMTIDGGISGGDLAFKTYVVSNVTVGPHDQIQPDGVDQARVLVPTSVTGQTISVGKEGRLSGIELSLDAPASTDDDLYLEVLRLDAGGPTSAGQVVITPQQIDAAERPLFLYHTEILGTYVDLWPLAAEVSPGDRVEVRLSTANTLGFYAIRLATTDVYAGGSLTINGAAAGGDLAFKLLVAEPLLFRDGFESGDVTGWSSASP